MANDLNQCTFVGRLGRDPELRTFPSGDQVANFSIAVGESWKDRATGEKKERTEWINIVASGGLAKVVGDFVRKGSQVLISGKFRTRKWTDQSGIEKYSTEIRADSMQMLGGKPGGTQQGNDGGQISKMVDERHQRPAPVPAPRASSGFEDMDDDSIPF